MAVVVVVSLLASIGSFAALRALDSAAQAREMTAARQMTTAYLTHAADHGGELMRAYQFGAKIEFPNGDVGSGPEADRYPWRLAPYLNWEIEETLLVNGARKGVQGKNPGSSDYRYAVSLGPALGINAYCVGGYENASGLLAADDVMTRLVQSDRSLVLFISARTKQGQTALPGSWFVRPPVMGPVRWKPGAFDPSKPSLDTGNVDFRYNGKAVTAFTDGSVRLMAIDELRDMRLWAKNADSANYSVRLSP